MIHKYFTPVLIALLCMYGGKISAKEISVQSPDGKLKVNIELKDKIYYSVYSGSDLLLSNCSLTMTLDNEVLGKHSRTGCFRPSRFVIYQLSP
jgi:alpha-glucosidase